MPELEIAGTSDDHAPWMKRRHGSGPDPFEQSPRKRDATQPSPSQAYEHQFAPSPDPYAMDAGSPGAPAGEPNTPFVLAGDGSYAPPSGGSPPYDNYQQQHSYHGHTTQHSYRPHQSPPLVLTASPMQVSSAQFGHHQVSRFASSCRLCSVKISGGGSWSAACRARRVRLPGPSWACVL